MGGAVSQASVVGRVADPRGVREGWVVNLACTLITRLSRPLKPKCGFLTPTWGELVAMWCCLFVARLNLLILIMFSKYFVHCTHIIC